MGLIVGFRLDALPAHVIAGPAQFFTISLASDGLSSKIGLEWALSSPDSPGCLSRAAQVPAGLQMKWQLKKRAID